MTEPQEPLSTSQWWRSALSSPEPEQPESPDFGAMSAAEYAQFRQQSAPTSDFVGVQGWTRAAAIRNIHLEPTAMQKYAQEREGLGIKDAPQSSAMQSIRQHMRGAWEAAQSNNPRRSQ